MRGDLATASRAAESEVELTLALGVGRWRGVLFASESPGVERRDNEWACGVREELAARGVEVDAESVLLDPLGYREGKDSEWDVWSGSAAETGCEGPVIGTWGGIYYARGAR